MLIRLYNSFVLFKAKNLTTKLNYYHFINTLVGQLCRKPEVLNDRNVNPPKMARLLPQDDWWVDSHAINCILCRQHQKRRTPEEPAEYVGYKESERTFVSFV